MSNAAEITTAAVNFYNGFSVLARTVSILFTNCSGEVWII